LGLGVDLRLTPLLLDALLALLGGNLVLEPLALELGLRLLALQLGFGVTLPCLRRLLAGFAFGIGLGLLKAPLTREFVAPCEVAESLLGLTDRLPDDPAGGPLGLLVFSQAQLLLELGF
jgi:hypothetical protein